MSQYISLQINQLVYILFVDYQKCLHSGTEYMENDMIFKQYQYFEN